MITLFFLYKYPSKQIKYPLSVAMGSLLPRQNGIKTNKKPANSKIAGFFVFEG
jgi:hypothetical protein